jgi:hypothetical protein
MARKRFSADERAILADGPDTAIEWQNVTQWHPGRLVTGEIHTDDGWQSARVINLRGTRTVAAYQVVWISPGHLRRPALRASLAPLAIPGDTVRTGLIISWTEHLASTSNANPRYRVHFTSGLRALTSSDAAQSAEFDHVKFRGVPLTVTFTRRGRIRHIALRTDQRQEGGS